MPENRITTPQALAILECSVPTLDKYVRDKKLTKYGGNGGVGGRPNFYDRDECVALKAQLDELKYAPVEV